jgi:hypothetical protein
MSPATLTVRGDVARTSLVSVRWRLDYVGRTDDVRCELVGFVLHVNVLYNNLLTCCTVHMAAVLGEPRSCCCSSRGVMGGKALVSSYYPLVMLCFPRMASGGQGG